MRVEKSCGAVLFTEIENKRHYVLVSEMDSNNCGLPKGHMENDESEEEAALREIFEEVGVKAEIIASFYRQIEYIMSNGVIKQVVYFAASFEGEPKKQNAEEGLNVIITPYEDAMSRITFDSVKGVFEEAETWLNSLSA